MTFTLALELSISMPVSWLPVAGDYTVRADSAVSASLMPFLGYGGGCIAMNLLGLYLGVMTGKDIFAFLPQSRFPVVACAIIVLSTVTTAFLDLYSACLSTMSVVRKTNAAAAGAGLKRGQNQTRLLIIGFVTVALSACFPMNRYGDFLTTFLTAIGSVFTPVYTVLFLDFLANKTGQGLVNLKNGWKLLAAAFGVAGYQVLSRTGFSAPTIAAIALTAFVWLVLVWLEKTLFIRKKEYVSH
jgi:purine-cytosine permease-like protein